MLSFFWEPAEQIGLLAGSSYVLNKELTWNCCVQFMESLCAIDLEKIRNKFLFSLAFGGFLLYTRTLCSLLLKKAKQEFFKATFPLFK